MEEDISLMNVTYTFAEIYKLFQDIIQEPSVGKVNKILGEYKNGPNKILYGYFIDKKIAGIMGLKKNGKIIEIEHLGIHLKQRGKGIEEKIIDHIKNKFSGKKIVGITDKEGMKLYEKKGFKIKEMEGKKMYKCELN
jgi:GNAT superfamily N-acetyltransferase